MLSLQEVPLSAEGEISELLLSADDPPLQLELLHVLRPELPALPAEHVSTTAVLSRALGPGLQTLEIRLLRDLRWRQVCLESGLVQVSVPDMNISHRALHRGLSQIQQIADI